MGRIFETRKATMFKRWDRMAKAFTRVGREIAVAVRAGGPNPDGNPALRRAIENARSVNMPKNNIKNAIEKAAGLNDTDDFKEILYEGYGPHGIAVLVVAATDNGTRTVANVRAAFKKNDGNLGTTGSVAFMFDQFAVFRLKAEGIDRDELELELIDHGLEQLDDTEDDKGNALLAAYCKRDDFGSLQTALEDKKIETVSSGFVWTPQTTTALSDEEAEAVMKLVEKLEEDDDVDEVFTNME